MTCVCVIFCDTSQCSKHISGNGVIKGGKSPWNVAGSGWKYQQRLMLGLQSPATTRTILLERVVFITTTGHVKSSRSSMLPIYLQKCIHAAARRAALLPPCENPPPDFSRALPSLPLASLCCLSRSPHTVSYQHMHACTNGHVHLL